MDRWRGKVAVVTGASSGIGEAIVRDLLHFGVQVVGLARRVERIDELRQSLPPTSASRLHCHKCDVSSEADILRAFRWIEAQFGGVDILVNNAGVLHADCDLLTADNSAQMRSTLDVNVLAPVLCTREAFKTMATRQGGGGHVVLMNSIAGHWVPFAVGSAAGSLNMYEPSKHAVTAMTEVLRQELQAAKSGVKVTSISPGSVRTEMYTAEMLAECAGNILRPEDVSAAVMYVLGTPAHVQVHDLIIKPLGEQYL